MGSMHCLLLIQKLLISIITISGNEALSESSENHLNAEGAPNAAARLIPRIDGMITAEQSVSVEDVIAKTDQKVDPLDDKGRDSVQSDPYMGMIRRILWSNNVLGTDQPLIGEDRNKALTEQILAYMPGWPASTWSSSWSRIILSILSRLLFLLISLLLAFFTMIGSCLLHFHSRPQYKTRLQVLIESYFSFAAVPNSRPCYGRIVPRRTN